ERICRAIRGGREPHKPHATSPVELVPGGFTWRGIRHPLSGKPRDVLAELLAAPGRACTAADLRRTVWADDGPQFPEQAVKDAVGRLRKALLKALEKAGGACSDGDPVPSDGSGKDLVYRLALPDR